MAFSFCGDVSFNEQYDKKRLCFSDRAVIRRTEARVRKFITKLTLGIGF